MAKKGRFRIVDSNIDDLRPNEAIEYTLSDLIRPGPGAIRVRIAGDPGKTIQKWGSRETHAFGEKLSYKMYEGREVSWASIPPPSRGWPVNEVMYLHASADVHRDPYGIALQRFTMVHDDKAILGPFVVRDRAGSSNDTIITLDVRKEDLKDDIVLRLKR